VFNHKLLATDGLFPGLKSTLSIATLGAFTIGIDITPVYPTGAGGGGVGPNLETDKYKVTIRVSFKDKHWKIERIVNKFMARVAARLTGVKLPEEPKIVITSVSARTITPEIKVDKI
jgi:hypothetical protein